MPCSTSNLCSESQLINKFTVACSQQTFTSWDVTSINYKKYQKIPKMDVTAIMEKTVKNTGGVAALQKNIKKCQKIFNGNCYLMPKNTKK